MICSECALGGDDDEFDSDVDSITLNSTWDTWSNSSSDDEDEADGDDGDDGDDADSLGSYNNKDDVVDEDDLDSFIEQELSDAGSVSLGSQHSWSSEWSQ